MDEKAYVVLEIGPDELADAQWDFWDHDVDVNRVPAGYRFTGAYDQVSQVALWYTNGDDELARELVKVDPL